MQTNRSCALVLTGTLLLSMLCSPNTLETQSLAAAKIKLNAKKIEVNAGSKKKVSVKGIAAKGIRKVVWKSASKKIATVKKSGKVSAKITGKKAGTTKITAKVYKKKEKKVTTLRLTVVVKAKKVTGTQTVSLEPTGTPAPAATVPTASPSSTPSTTPSTSPSTSPPVLRTPASIQEAYQGIFTYMGSCANYYGYSVKKDQLRTKKTVDFIKKHYNSITLENEMKPDAVLGNSVTKLTVAQAQQKGLYVPENYPETYVPQLNLGTVNSTLQTLYDEGLTMRAHTLLWHQQTPSWFFTVDYNGQTVVSEEIMNARLEYFVRNTMRLVMDTEKKLTGTNGTLLYAWDVTNEYIHRFHDAASITWTDVYGDQGLTPTYVKKAFEIAYEELEQYGVEDDVILYYNDYDTYECEDEIIQLIGFINTDKTICRGIGMQSHITVNYPGLESYGNALDKFLATGLEVSITELDVSINYDRTGSQDAHGFDIWSYKDMGQTDEDQAKFMQEFMELLVSRQKNRDRAVNPKGIVGVTLWGLFDTCSWKANTTPLLFGTSIDDPKPSYDAFIKASDLWYQG